MKTVTNRIGTTPRPPSARVPEPGEHTALRYDVALTPVGFAFVAASEVGVCALYLLDDEDPSPGLGRLRKDYTKAALTLDPGLAPSIGPAVALVIEGTPGGEVALDLRRGTPFQKRVWEALRAIPRGATTTYGALALSLGLPLGAARAVGAACGSNPVSLLVPCHRVVGAGGGLGGYYWGLDRKRRLLELESTPSTRPGRRA